MTVVLRTPAIDDPALDARGVRAALLVAFGQVQKAIGADEDIVVVVPAADLLGHRGPARAALVGGLVGIVRAVAFEGARPGWRINALALPDEVDLSDDTAVERVPDGLSGQVVTMGTALIGKVAP
ncbi:hypothetical protein KVF89_14140 [Nocardioides carbamazepini]|uniref:hypothetical protein n=1 Tax=Nocardioides carbamazepini TaxID=2854259 RepID=UPI00214A1580|nr:hypothetical protein [Nocardioides carbamazepini]MCR1783677.1 hypothetical protein [Nocardioides carbamazepini]